MTDQLEELAKLWRERFSERARGGAASLEGYRFQLLVAIRDAVCAFLDGKADAPTVFVETVSDICQRTAGGEVLFTQVKRTGRSVSGALEELWAIHALAVEHLRGMAPKLRYRILCAQWTLKDVEGAIDRWRPAGSAHRDQLDSFKSRVEASTDVNPMDELLDLVANRLNADRPMSTVLSWVGRLTSLPEGAHQFWDDLCTLRNEGRTREGVRPYVWAPGDRPPPTTVGEVLISEQPKLIHLRQGYFADRAIYSSLAQEALEWIESVTHRTEGTSAAQILWLGGRSGCGKSVAMLHVLSRLQTEGIGPVLWLGSGTDLLAQAVRRVPSVSTREETVIIAVDDPYAPRTQGDDRPWREALVEIEQLQNLGRTSLPILVCCGPTEQAERLSEDFAGEVFVHTVKVPHTLDDRKELEAWYQKRTGKSPPVVGQGDLLLVQLFFQWQTGTTLKAFAKKFRKRLLEADASRGIFDTVRRILAANRIYAGYPTGALEAKLAPPQRDAFEQLVRDHHFAIDEDPARAGVWLTHPHIADAVFEAWLPAVSHSHERRSVIQETILDGVHHTKYAKDQTALLWALVRQARGDDILRKRVEADRPELLLPGLYAAWRKVTGAPLPFGHLPAWITLRCRIEGLGLEPDPVAEALDRLIPENRGMTGFRLTCHKLIEHWQQLTEPERENATRRLAKVLSVARDWHEWSFIAEDIVVKTKDREISGLVTDHLEDDGRNSARMLTRLFLRRSKLPNPEWLFESAVRWIERHLEEVDTGPVLSAALRRHDLGLRFDSIAHHAIAWSQRFSSSPSVELVLRRLLRLPLTPSAASKVAGLILDYLQTSGLKPSSSFLLGSLLRPGTLQKLGDLRVGDGWFSANALAIGLDWTDQFPSDAGLPYVADQLLRLAPSVLSDKDWSRIASVSLSRLSSRPLSRDSDYSLLSIVRRRSLLNEEEWQAWCQCARSWLHDVEVTISRLRPKKRFRAVSRSLAAALPLAAHLGDEAIQSRLASATREFRNTAQEPALKDFDRLVGRLLTNRTWPCGIPTIITRINSDFGSVDRDTGWPRADRPTVTSAADRR